MAITHNKTTGQCPNCGNISGARKSSSESMSRASGQRVRGAKYHWSWKMTVTGVDIKFKDTRPFLQRCKSPTRWPVTGDGRGVLWSHEFSSFSRSTIQSIGRDIFSDIINRRKRSWFMRQLQPVCWHAVQSKIIYWGVHVYTQLIYISYCQKLV